MFSAKLDFETPQSVGETGTFAGPYLRAIRVSPGESHILSRIGGNAADPSEIWESARTEKTSSSDPHDSVIMILLRRLRIRVLFRAG
jgi:hypothetical protein